MRLFDTIHGRYGPLIVSVLIHALAACAFFLVRFEVERHEREPVHLFMFEMAEKAPTVDDIPDRSEEPIVREHPTVRERPTADRPVTTTQAKEPPSLRAPDIVDLPRETSEPSPEKILDEDQAPYRFTPFADGDFRRPYADSSGVSPFERGAVLFEGEPWELRPSWIPEEDVPLSSEEATDERRKFTPELFGIHMDGPLGIIPFMVYAGKIIALDFREGDHPEKVARMRDSRFAGVTERDIRFMILVWREGLLDPVAMTRRDRLFVECCPETPPRTHARYLWFMYRRGLVDALVVGGRMVFRAAFPRDEMLSVLSAEAYGGDDTEERFGLARLILACYDHTAVAVAIPDSLVREGR